MAAIYIAATLGPSGTDSQRAALHFSRSSDILLCNSFEEALKNVREGIATFGIVPAAYSDLFSLHYEFRDLEISSSFAFATKELVLAKKPNSEIRKVALHPCTDCLAPKGAEFLHIKSKPLCIDAVVNGEADAAIGSLDVALDRGLEIVKNYGKIPMTWEVFGRYK